MKFLGQEAISGPTRTSARALLVTAAILAMIEIGWVDIQGLTVFEVRIADGKAESALRGFTAFLMVAHAVQWAGDYLSYRAWNTIGAEPSRVPVWSGRPERNKFATTLNELKEMVIAAPEDPYAKKRFGGEEGSMIIDGLSSLASSVTTFHGYAVFYVWVWYGALPVTAGLCAILWSWHG